MADNIDNTLKELDDILKNAPQTDADEENEEVANVTPDEQSDASQNEQESENGNEPEEPECPFCIKNGSYVTVEPDAMTAKIFLVPPTEKEDFYSVETIMQFIKENGVVCGYHQSNIAAIAKKHVYDREIVVAKGQFPIDGINGYYEYFFDTSDKRKPTIREDGTVDYASMSRLTNVSAGDVIAKYHSSVSAVDGFDVLGHEFKSKPPKDLPNLKGLGFSNEEDPNVYVATTDGRIDFRGGKIDIKNVYEVRGDVDLITGKIEFFGDITIKGNVGAGVVVRGSRNVTIEGVVESADIYAGGDIVITRGVQGAQKANISAKGSVFAEFIEYANVTAGDTVHANSFIGSTVYAEGTVFAEGKNGLILGGSTRGLLGVSAMSLGNDAETKTFVASGYSAREYEQYVELMSKESRLQKALSDTVDRMSAILKEKRLGKGLKDEEQDKELALLNERKDEFFNGLDKARQAKEALEETIEKGKGSYILANDKVFRGVTVCIEGKSMAVPSNTCYVRYKNEGGRVVSGPV